ncbi:MAG: MFS transporter [Solirubrobacteraceae bacterium]
MAALVLFVLGSVLSTLSWNDARLIGFRILQGFAAGLIMPLIQTLAVSAAGGHPSSRLMAAVSLPVGMALLAPALALATILLGLSNLSKDGSIDHAGVLVWLLVGIALLAAFVAWALHRGGRPPIVGVRLLRRRSLGSASAVLFTTGAAMYAALFLLPLYYQQLRGDTVLHAGLIMTPQGVGALAARLIVGKLVDRFGARTVTIASFLLAAAATVPFAFAGPHTNQWWVGALLLVRGLGIGAVLIPSMTVAYQDVPSAGIPHATMNTRIAQQVGASCGVAIVAVALQCALAHGATSAFQGAFWWAIGITIAAAIPAIALPANTPTSDSPAAKPVHNDETASRRLHRKRQREPSRPRPRRCRARVRVVLIRATRGQHSQAIAFLSACPRSARVDRRQSIRPDWSGSSVRLTSTSAQKEASNAGAVRHRISDLKGCSR